jgi:tetratricopeptide (TPR) repeat protein
MAVTLIVAVALVLAGAAGGGIPGQQPETLSLLGEPLYAPPLSKAARSTADAALAEARARYDAAPNDIGAILALEQAHLTLGRVGDALEILTHGLEANPDEARLQLERGRSYIRIRKFELAQKDLRKAAETLPSAHCPLGLARYLAADYANARESYGKCADPGVFGYLATRRAGGTASAPPSGPLGPAPSTPPPITFPGTPASKTAKPREPIARMYLDAVELLLDEKKDEARGALKKIVEKNRNDWMEPAYIAAEVDYAKVVKAEGKRHKAKRNK